MNSNPTVAAVRDRRTRALVAASPLLRVLATGVLIVLTPWARAAETPAGAAPDYADLSLEQLMDLNVARVYGASKHDQKVTQAPSSVSIVTADEVRQFGWRTLSDILRSVRGFYNADDRNYMYLGARGFLRPGDFNTRMLVLIDGHRMNDNIYDGGYVGREQMIATDLIERVEVIRGPSSSVYGSSAFFGVINIVTKRPEGNGAQLSTEVGNNRTFENRLTFDHRFRNGVDWLISASVYTSDGEDRLYYPEFDPRLTDDPAAANNGVAVDSDREHVSQMFTSLRYRDFTLSAFISRRRKDVPTASYGTAFNAGRERTYDRRGYLDLKVDRMVGSHRLQGRVFYDKYRYDGAYPYDYAEPGDPPDIRLDYDGAVGEWVGTEWQINASLSPAHTLIAGTEVRENLREHQYYYVNGAVDLDRETSSRSIGLFAQWEAQLRKNLLLSAGVRHDNYDDTFGGTTNPRIALIYQLSDVATIKALHGSAYRAPNPYEAHYYDLQELRPPLQPERIRTRELVFERYWGSEYRANLSIYDYDIDRLITQRSTDAGDLYFENIDATTALGAELEVEAKYASGWLARASYALQRSEDRRSGEWLSSSPRSLAKLNVAWAPTGKEFSVGLEAQYQSASRTLSGARSGDFTLVNLHLFSARLVRGFELSLTAANLFDVRYAMPGGEDAVQDLLGQPRRALRLKIARNF